MSASKTGKLVKITAVDKKLDLVVTDQTLVEDGLVSVCKQLRVKPLCRHLFGLRCDGAQWVPLGCKIADFADRDLELRIRFRTPSVETLVDADLSAFDFYFFQVREDVINDRVADISYEKHKEELMGLSVSDMYRVKIEKGLTRDNLLNDYKRYTEKLRENDDDPATQTQKIQNRFVTTPLNWQKRKKRRNRTKEFEPTCPITTTPVPSDTEWLSDDDDMSEKEVGMVTEPVQNIEANPEERWSKTKRQPHSYF
ncbi:unnamed protein product [Nesidiocoris tenuis]|uniref:FERM domain-containing protein n=1 Tax=Nesidiocoris tenuis TaxID=355587 RepID=A0A6H5GEU2_9HEMI|nr:unnamed protein product [Nesidiocoris tenuis]